jgi:transposase
VTRAQREKESRRAQRQERYAAVLALHQQGHSQREIAALLGIGRRTVRFFVRAEGFPERAAGRRRRPLLARYLPYLRERWAAGCQNAAQLWRELRAQGYAGAVRNVRQCVATWRAQPGTGGRPRPTPSSKRAPVPPAVPSYSARQATWLLVRAGAALEPDEARFVAHLTSLSPVIQALQELACAFHALVRTQDHGALDPWLCAAEHSGIPEVCGFAAGLRADASAVEAALLLPWSQGQTEGHVNKLKVLKRQGFGRAKLDLLRQRLLHAS